MPGTDVGYPGTDLELSSVWSYGAGTEIGLACGMRYRYHPVLACYALATECPVLTWVLLVQGAWAKQAVEVGSSNSTARSGPRSVSYGPTRGTLVCSVLNDAYGATRPAVGHTGRG
eukprot:2060099-Rhodomonas_salina.2